MSQMLPPPSEWAHIPVVAPPPGVTPNFANPPESLAPGATAAIAVILVLSMTALTVRLYTKARIVRRLGWDDWTALIGGIVTLGAAILTLALLNLGGLGPHSWNVPLSDILTPGYSRRLIMDQILNQIDMYFIKLSIMLFLLKIFPRSSRPVLAYLLYGGIALATITVIATSVYEGVTCMPTPSDFTFPEQCQDANRNDVGITTASVDAAIDLYLLAISIPAILVLQMSLRKKVGIVLVLSTGAIACLCSLLALVYRINSPKLGLTAAVALDPSWSAVPSITVGMVEPMVALIAACLPCMPSFWSELSPRARESLRRLRSRITGASGTSLSHGSQTGSTTFRSNASRDRDAQYGGHSSIDDLELGGIKREDRFEVHTIAPPRGGDYTPYRGP